MSCLGSDRVGPGYAGPAALDGHYRSLFQVLAVQIDSIFDKGDSFRHSYVGEPYQARVRDMQHIDQLSKALVQGDEHSVFRRRQLQQVPVPGVSPDVSSIEDIVALVVQMAAEPAPYAAVHQEPHASPTDTADSDSPAMTV